MNDSPPITRHSPHLPVIDAVDQVILGVDGPVERAPFGGHGGHLLWRRVPVVPLAVDRVVATEDRHPVILRVRPGGGAVGQRFGEEEQRARRAAVGFPDAGIGVVDRVRRGIDPFVGAGDEERAARPFDDRVQFPDHAHETSVGLAGNTVIGVRIAREAQHAAAVVRPKFPLPQGAVEEVA